MKVEQQIREKIQGRFQPLYFEVENESHNHSVPKNSETHFRVLIVSSSFEGLSRIDRQREVNGLLAEELKNGVHALTQRVFTPAEWDKVKGTFQMQSPPCHGGSKFK